MTILHGVDVHAKYQSGFNIENVPNVDFVITKCTGGTSYIVSDWTTMLDNAYLIGVYHYAREKGYAGSAEDEAYNFINQAKNISSKANLFLDWEESTNNDLGDVDWILEWMSIVKKELKRKPILYTYEAVLKKYPDLSKVKDAGYSLWYARYPYTKSVGWQDWDQPDATNWGKPIMWQYSSAGMVEGWQKALDLNIFYGDKDKWLELSSSIEDTTEEDSVVYVKCNDKKYRANLLFGTYQEVSASIQEETTIDDISILGVEIK
jgi:GH25 family lysozyme M1 (1,4-beta-N-acetylmuramidase)